VFARPSRITAETGVGRAGVINIEREADMSGKVHIRYPSLSAEIRRAILDAEASK